MRYRWWKLIRQDLTESEILRKLQHCRRIWMNLFVRIKYKVVLLFFLVQAWPVIKTKIKHLTPTHLLTFFPLSPSTQSSLISPKMVTTSLRVSVRWLRLAVLLAFSAPYLSHNKYPLRSDWPGDSTEAKSSNWLQYKILFSAELFNAGKFSEF